MTTFKAGNRQTAAALNGAIGLTAIKGADTARTSTTTLTADPDLTVAVLANTTYVVRFSLLYKGGATNASDFKFGFSVPAGATFAGGAITIANPLAVAILPVASASSVLVSYSNGTGNPLWCQVTAGLIVSGTAGSLALTWAQNTSSGTATTLMTGSSLQAVAK